MRSIFVSHLSIIPTSSSLQNQWTTRYWSLTYIYFMRSIFVSFWSIILKYDITPSNSLQDIRQNHWTMKYRSFWPLPHDTKVNVIGISVLLSAVNKAVLLNFCRVWCFVCVCFRVFCVFFCKISNPGRLDEYGSDSKELIRILHLMYGNE